MKFKSRFQLNIEMRVSLCERTLILVKLLKYYFTTTNYKNYAASMELYGKFLALELMCVKRFNPKKKKVQSRLRVPFEIWV